MMLDKGMVLMGDTRTNSGVDNISTFRKLHHWEVPGERIIAVLTAGNLATTQLEAPTMFQVASIVGRLLRETIIATDKENGQEASGTFTASMIVAGQIRGMEPRLFLIYPEGNFIEASFDTPFFQIGETKYGRPILIRGYSRDMSFEDAVKLLMVSFDSTLKANLSVGMPLDLMVIERDRFEPAHECRIEAEDPYYRSISAGWSEALKLAFESLPDYSFRNR
jgi:putative proteasome-type protease